MELEDAGKKVKWVEVTVNQTEEKGAAETSVEQSTPVGNLYIEYGALRMTADGWYPIECLAALLREMCAAC